MIKKAKRWKGPKEGVGEGGREEGKRYDKGSKEGEKGLGRVGKEGDERIKRWKGETKERGVRGR